MLYFCYLYFIVKWKLKEGKDSVHGYKARKLPSAVGFLQ